MKITEKDIGRKVKLRCGDETHISSIGDNEHFPVETGIGWSHTFTGGVWSEEEDAYDIIGFVDEVNVMRTPDSVQALEQALHTTNRSHSIAEIATELLNMLKEQGINQLTIVTDIGEINCDLKK